MVGGFLQVRQRIIDITEERWDDDTACCGLVLDPELVPVEARATKAFQGWRYLPAEDAPPDVIPGQETVRGLNQLPPKLRAALRDARLI